MLPLLLLTFSACGDDDDNGGTPTGTVELFFKPVYGDEDVLIDRTENLDYPTGKEIRIIVSDMFIGPLSLSGNDGATELSEIEFINLSEPILDQQTGLTDKVLVFDNVPAGIYSGFEFGIGIPEDLNKKAPSDFPAGHPMRRESHYWPPWNSYIFSKIEGRKDVNQDGGFGLNFVYHAGLDELYRYLNFSGTLEVRPGEITRMELVIDHKKLLSRSGSDFLDIEANPVDHSAGDLEYMRFIVDNYASAISLRVYQ
ncbi:MAG: hypothetical protein EA409_13845 [Saprospirales bacterium]|nr:MAG: hypothetical protein EA409_13845 [Saprospirales bacterium]